jgi:hypothetical protein
MEPGLQPTFTFPSRRQVANKAWALDDQVNMNLNMIVPPNRAAIDPWTLWENPLTFPPTLNLERIAWQGKIPVSEPIYFPKRLAETLTAEAQSQAYSVEYESLLAANNALKRDNYSAAEFILGRKLTAEEIENRTITPNVRASSTQPGNVVHQGNKAGQQGTTFKSGEEQHHEVVQRAKKVSNTAFIYALAKILKINPSVVTQLRTRFGVVGQEDFSFWSDLTQEQKQQVLRTVVHNIRTFEQESDAERAQNGRLAREQMGAQDPEAAARDARRDQARGERFDPGSGPGGPGGAPPPPPGEGPPGGGAGGGPSQGMGKQERKEREEKRPESGPVYAGVHPGGGHDLDGGVGGHARPDAPLLGLEGLMPPTVFPSKGAESQPVELKMQEIVEQQHDLRNDSQAEVKAQESELRNWQGRQLWMGVPVPEANDNGPAIRREADSNEARAREVLSAPRREAKGDDPDNLEYVQGGGEYNDADPGVLRDRDYHINLSRLGNYRDLRHGRPLRDGSNGPLRSQAETTEVNKLHRQLEFARNRAEMRGRESEMDVEPNPPGGARRSDRIRHKPDVLNYAKKGGRLSRNLVAVGGSLNPSLRAVSDLVRERYVRQADGTLKRQVRRQRSAESQSRGNPRAHLWEPRADGYFGDRAFVSGELMRKTGTDALPISAQIQVPETHTFADAPVSRLREFPNVVEDLKTDKMADPKPLGVPIAARAFSGVGAAPKRVQFGRYWVDFPKLMNKAVLTLHHKGGAVVHGWERRAVGGALHDAIMGAIDGKKVHLDKLKGEDRHEMGHLLSHTRAMPAVFGGADRNLDPKQHLKVVMGEMQAGNDSDDLKSQLRSLVSYMLRVKQLDAKHAKAIRRDFL